MHVFPYGSQFLPTPSARRATRSHIGYPVPARVISTHALREEGDTVEPDEGMRLAISTHALREEGDVRLLYMGFK